MWGGFWEGEEPQVTAWRGRLVQESSGRSLAGTDALVTPLGTRGLDLGYMAAGMLPAPEARTGLRARDRFYLWFYWKTAMGIKGLRGE